jgi:superfamily II DNA or RNA helicase
MSNNIDRLVDRRRAANRSPGAKLQDSFLDNRPTSQWPSYLDEIATDVQAGIGIGDTDLDKLNFPEEVGPLYQRGMVATVGEHSDLPVVLEETLSDEALGQLVFLINQLQYNISRSDTGLTDIQRAITAVLEKLLTESHGRVDPHLGRNINSTADVLIQLFSDPIIAQQAEDILEEFERTYNQGLLAKLDEPQLMTPLWDHQRDALANWAETGFRGYADMATATGKTVLGLAAIALRYGNLHPVDEDIDRRRMGHGARKAEVLVVAHNDLILEQWRREFDCHLNIPEDRTRESDDVELTWGRVHFRTAQALLNRDHIEYDLVILDEAHHYANGSGWGQLLDSFQNDVLALSGSVDEGNEADSKLRDRFEETIGPEVKHYSITDAQRDGVIPTFEWRVEYVPTASSNSEFVEITEKANVRFSAFRERLTRGQLDIETDRRLRTHDDIRRFSHTTEGEELKRTDDQFKELVTTLFSRRTQRWNQSPRLDTVVDAVHRHSDEKVVVLTNNNAQIDRLAELLARTDGIDAEQVHTVYGSDSSADQRDTVDAFDEPGTPAVLIGTGSLIGEGVDMQHASVGINMSTGSVNKQLIQRIGRVLRNPDGDKQATFLNLVGLPADRAAQAPADDGQFLIENAQRYVAFGDRFENAPTFATASETMDDAVRRLLRAGFERITTLDEDGTYDWPATDSGRTQLEELLSAVERDIDRGSTAVLDAWSNEFDDGVFLVVTDATGTPVANAFVSATSERSTVHGRTDDRGQFSFEGSETSYTVAIRHTDAGLWTDTIDATARNRHSVTLAVPNAD